MADTQAVLVFHWKELPPTGWWFRVDSETLIRISMACAGVASSLGLIALFEIA
jgi:hypothetical protein